MNALERDVYNRIRSMTSVNNHTLGEYPSPSVFLEAYRDGKIKQWGDSQIDMRTSPPYTFIRAGTTRPPCNLRRSGWAFLTGAGKLTRSH